MGEVQDGTAHFQPVLTVDRLAPGQLAQVEVDGASICIARTRDELTAFDNACPHRQQPLSEGSLDGTVLTCAGHEWQFDVITGKLLDLRAPFCLAKWQTRVRDGVIEVAR